VVWIKRVLWVLVGAAVVLAFVRAFRTPPVLVDVAEVARGELVVTVDDDGRTRVRDRYTIHAPTDGRLLRIPFRAGARVVAGETVLAEFEPRTPVLLDARTRAEAEARVEAAEASVERTRAVLAQAEADLDYAKAELARRRELVRSGTETQSQLDLAQRDERRADEGLRAARFALDVSEHELGVARAALVEETNGTPGGVLALRSPIDGRVLRVFEESARTIAAGTPILEIGDTARLEVVAEYLSQDAVKVAPGMHVLLDGWGGELPGAGEETLHGEVRLVEPGGFTKVSALGVEEQRVDVLVDPVEPLEGWARLQDGYRVDLRIVVARREDVVIVPTGALFRERDAWAVFVVEDGVAREREVELGQRNGLEAEVARGLAPGERVVLYPSELVGDGTAVEVR